jgi:hypothetical protein
MCFAAGGAVATVKCRAINLSKELKSSLYKYIEIVTHARHSIEKKEVPGSYQVHNSCTLVHLHFGK